MKEQDWTQLNEGSGKKKNGQKWNKMEWGKKKQWRESKK